MWRDTSNVKSTLVVLILLASGCGSGHSAVRAIVSQTGQIGPLRMDRSTRGDVVSFVGRPDAERNGAEGIGAGAQHFRALGYDCSEKPHDDAFGLRYPPNGRAGPFCETVFWISRRTGRLGDFYTTSARYSESHGVRIGMRTAEAEHRTHELAYVGCGESIFVGPGGRDLTIALDGGTAHKLRGSTGIHLVGGHVYAFALHDRSSEVGVFDCL
jgi:hypothetical protein